MLVGRLSDYALRQMRGQVVVVGKFHREIAASLRHRTQIGGIPLAFGQRNVGGNDGAPINDGMSMVFVDVVNVQDVANPRIAFDQVVQFQYSGMEQYEVKKVFDLGDILLTSLRYETLEGQGIHVDVYGIVLQRKVPTSR